MFDESESIPTPLPPSVPQSQSSDLQAQLQQYLSGLHMEIQNQLRSVHQRLDAVAAHQTASADVLSSSPPIPSHSPPPIPSFHRSSTNGPLSQTRARESVPSASTTLSKLLSKPSHFHGEHGNRVYDWLSELDITFDNIENATDHQKITFARQCLRDEALRWWIAREQEVQNSRYRIRVAQLGDLPGASRDAHETKEITTWPEFKQVFVDYFCPRGASEAARNQLHALRQSQFRDLAGYCDRFETIARRITTAPGHDITEELIATFKTGLSDGRIRLHLTTGHPASLFEATRQAMQAESDLRVSNAGGRDNHTSRSFGFGRPQQYGLNKYLVSGHRHESRNWSTGNHGASPYRSGAPSHFIRRSPGPNAHGFTRDTTAPMDLSFANAEDEESRAEELLSPSDAPFSVAVEDGDETAITDDDYVRDAASLDDERDSEQQINFVTREHRSSDRPPWRPSRAGQYDRTRAASGKQQAALRNTCWNCGKLGHFLIDCPFHKPTSMSAAAVALNPTGSAPAAMFKPNSKKF